MRTSGIVATGLVIMARSAAADPTESAPPACRTVDGYAEPSGFAIGGSIYKLMARFAAGAAITDCESGLRGRAGATLIITDGIVHGPGGGGELAVSYPVHPRLRVGLRVGFEVSDNNDGRIGSLGVRLQLDDAFWVGLDGYHSRDGFESQSGVMGGVGYEGRWKTGVVMSGIAAAILIGISISASAQL